MCFYFDVMDIDKCIVLCLLRSSFKTGLNHIIVRTTVPGYVNVIYCLRLGGVPQKDVRSLHLGNLIVFLSI